MLNKDQSIIFRKDNHVEMVVDINNLEALCGLGFAFPIRNAALLTEGSRLVYPLLTGQPVTTSNIAEVRRDGSTTHYRTVSGSEYSVELEGIDVDATFERGLVLGMESRADGGMELPVYPTL
ncbi:hypothetical protein HOD38_04645 [archaeon]|jgi:hypothetical protein|nr:hypothetical protein [archaeon]MBT4397531.1 hypothetical protein [archaeon]MBT4440788.1 hypothetical protein [archaeon]